MSSIHFVGGEKGGIGKSVLARLLAQYHIDRGLPFAAFDSDGSHGALLRFYGDYSRPLDLTDFASADQLVETALAASQDVIVDLAAQTSAALDRWIEDNDLLGLAAELNLRIVFWQLLDDGADAIALLARLLDRHAAAAAYVIVRNFGRGKDFSAFERSAARARADALRAERIDLPELQAASMRKIDHAGLSLWAAANSQSGGLGLMERQRARIWMNRVYRQFDRLAPTLMTARPAAAAPPGASGEAAPPSAGAD